MPGRHEDSTEGGSKLAKQARSRWRWRWRCQISGMTLVALLATAVATDVLSANDAQAATFENHTISVAGFFGNMDFNSSNSQASASLSNQVGQQLLEVGVNDGQHALRFQFASRDSSNEGLKVGYYGDAQRYPFTDPGQPGISITGFDGAFCSRQAGNFEVRDLVLNGFEISRIWITYQWFCNKALPFDEKPVFGEIKLGYPPAAYEVSPSIVRWPLDTEIGKSAVDVPVTVRPTGATAVSVTSVSVDGPAPASFPIRGHNCTGTLTSAGCTVWIDFAPTTPGPRYARLLVATTAGTATITLDGAGAIGITSWTIDIDYPDSDSRADEHLELPWSVFWGSPWDLAAQGAQENGTLWNFSLRVVQPDLYPEKLAEGGHYVSSPDFDGTGMNLSMTRGNAACGSLVNSPATVDIANLAVTGSDTSWEWVQPIGRLVVLDLTLEVTCGHTVRSRLRFHDRGDFKGPFKVSNVTAVREGGSVSLSWTNPPSVDFARTIVRWYPGEIAPGTPDTGNLARFGTTNSVRFSAPSTVPTAISIWTVDTTGNVGLRYTLVVP
jgi:hypothetical protein